ncbi:MAG: hypothetical protein EPO40_25035 [Myxococcaceae bacterium]|nr:MAG: hypothetical protein EPO40_25035 [Myxococcaceae bacterium]
MSKPSRLGKMNIFSATAAEPTPAEPEPAPTPAPELAALAPVEPAAVKAPTLGRPATHEEWTKVTVVLFNRQIVFLDRLANDIRAKTGAAIRRAEILRALVDALESEGIDLSEAKSEADLKALLRARLRA